MYVDTSVLVAYYLPEPMSARAQAALEGDEDPVISEFVELEFLSALSVRVRRRELSRSNAVKVAALFSGH